MVAVILLLTAAPGGPAWCQPPDRPPTTLQVYTLLGEEAVRQALGDLPDTGSVLVTVYPDPLAWIVRGGILTGIAACGLRPSPDSMSRYTGEFGITAMRVGYERLSGGGLFGKELLRRSVTLGLGATVTDRKQGTVAVVPATERVWSDTVEGADLGRIEQPRLDVTRGVVPPVGLFDALAEPLIAIGAIAIALYLLFTVRS